MDIIVIRTVLIADSVKAFVYPYKFHTIDEVLATLGDTLSSVLYACASQAMIPLSTSLGSRKGHHGDHSCSDDEIAKVQHPAISADSGWHVADRGRTFNDHSYAEVWLTADQIPDPPHALRNVYARRCSWLVHPFHIYQFNYTCSRMMETISSTGNPDGATVSGVLEKSARRSVLKQELKMVIVDVRHCRQAFMTPWNDSGRH